MYCKTNGPRKRRVDKVPRNLVTINRNNKLNIAANLPNILNINPRSVYNKITQFKTFILEKKIDLVCISESWERPNETLECVIDIDGYSVISNPHQRRGCGGRPAILINNTKYKVENPNQSLLNIPWGVEIVWAILTPKDVTNSSIIKKIIVGSFYSKPGGRKKGPCWITLLRFFIYYQLNIRMDSFGSWLEIKMR